MDKFEYSYLNGLNASRAPAKKILLIGALSFFGFIKLKSTPRRVYMPFVE